MECRVVEMACTRGQHDNNNSYYLLSYLMNIVCAPALHMLCHFNPGHFIIQGNKIKSIISLLKVPIYNFFTVLIDLIRNI